MLNFLVEHQPPGTQPPIDWPVNIKLWFTVPGDARSPRAYALAEGLVTMYGERAKVVWADGGVLELAVRQQEDWTIAGVRMHDPDEADAALHLLWIVPNERGGVTLR